MGEEDLYATLIVHGCILSLKVLLMYPMSVLMCKLNISSRKLDYEKELKVLLPFFIVASLYLTISPDFVHATNLFRLFTLSRWVDCMCCSVLLSSYDRVHKLEIMSMLSHLVTGIMACEVLMHYRHAL